jgi:hypothetical protein
MQDPHVTKKSFELSVGADSEATHSQFEQRALFRLRDGSAAGHLANGFVVSFLLVGSKPVAQSIHFGLKVAKLNSG